LKNAQQHAALFLQALGVILSASMIAFSGHRQKLYAAMLILDK
jgi:hypothetical protein